MGPAPAGASGLVRVTVASSTRRADLVLPGAVPVAELLPELARSVGLLHATTVHGGYRLVTREGRELRADAGLTSQGVEHGGVLTVAAGADDAPPRVYDDVAEAMADAVERDARRWGPVSGRRAGLAVAALLMVLAAVALLLQDSSRAAAAAGVVSAGLVAGAVVLSRVRDEAEAGVVTAWAGCALAAVAGSLLGSGGAHPVALELAGAGAGALVAGMVTAVGLDAGRPMTLPPVVVGAVLLPTGLVLDIYVLDPSLVLTTVLVAIVMSGSVLPSLALRTTSTRSDRLDSIADITRVPREVDATQVAADARYAHQILVAVSATTGLMLVVVAPLAVSRGISGTLLAANCALVVMLRTRRHRAFTGVLVGLVSGAGGLAAVGASVLVLHPGWRPVAASVTAAGGMLLLLVTLVFSASSVRRRRFAEVAEGLALLAMLPLLVLTTGMVWAVRS